MIRARRLALLLNAALMALLPAVALTQRFPESATRCPSPAPNAEQRDRVALVLSGGGARGLAHIGVLRVLDSIGVRPDMVVGTSMGALVGALYAAGLSGNEIDSLARALPFEALFRRYTPIVTLTDGDFGSPVTVIPPTFVLEVSNGRLRVQSPVAREPQINALFNELLLQPNLVAAGDFDRLPVRFRAVATDVRTRSTVVLGHGDLAEAVRASIAIPVVFAPVRMNGQLLVDGGLTANVPVDVARQIGATRVIVSEVGSSIPDSIDATSTTAMLAYLIDELFTQPSDSLGPADLVIRPPVRRYRALDFTDDVVGPLIDSGYHAAASAFPGCSATPVQRPRLPAPLPGAELDLVRQRLELLAEQNVYGSVWLRPSLVQRLDTVRPSGRGALRFAPVAEPAPDRVSSIGVGYDGHEGGRLWLAAMNLTPPGGRFRVSGSLFIGEWRQRLVLGLTGLRRHPLPAVPDSLTSAQVELPDPRVDRPPWSTLASPLPRLEMSLTAKNETVRLFDGRGRERAEPRTRDLVLFAGLSRSLNTGQRVAIGAVAHIWSTRDVSPDEDRHAIGAMARAVHTLPPPTGGPNPNRVPLIAVEAMWLDRYHRLHAQAELAMNFGTLMVRPRGAAGWSDGLPLGAQFVLGAPHEFPGLRPGERRGDRYAFGSLALIRRISGPLFAQIEAGGGRSSFVHPLQARVVDDVAQGWVRGLDVGLVVDTPLGPISMAYGLSNTDRSIFKLRFGY